MARTLIVVKKKGLLVPQDFLQKALIEYPASIGAASVDDNAVWVSRLEGPIDIDSLMAVQESLKDSRVVLSFTQSNSKIHGDDLQPYSILRTPDAKDNEEGMSEHSLVAFVQGSLPNFERPNASIPAEAFYAREFLTEKIMDLVDKHEDDLDKVFEDLKSTKSYTELLMPAVGDAQVTIVGANDKHWSLVRGANKSFEWGDVSDDLGYGKADTKSLKEPEKPKRISIFQRAPTAKLGDPPPLPPRKTPDAPAPVTPPAPPTETKIPPNAGLPAGVTVDASGTHWYTYPTKKHTRDQIRNGYEKHAGFKPDGYRDCPRVKIDRAKTQIEALRVVADEPAKAEPVKNADKPKLVIASTEPAKTAVPTVPSPKLPILDDTGKLAVMEFMDQDFIKKTLGPNSQVIFDPKEIPTLEGKLLTFEEQTGHKLEDTVGLKYEHLVDMATNWSIESLAIYAMDWRRKYLQLADKIGDKKPAAKAPDTKPAEPVKVDAPPPARKSIFARRAG